MPSEIASRKADGAQMSGDRQASRVGRQDAACSSSKRRLIYALNDVAPWSAASSTCLAMSLGFPSPLPALRYGPVT